MTTRDVARGSARGLYFRSFRRRSFRASVSPPQDRGLRERHLRGEEGGVPLAAGRGRDGPGGAAESRARQGQVVLADAGRDHPGEGAHEAHQAGAVAGVAGERALLYPLLHPLLTPSL
eukprot:8042249-Pyramimonas_sp.AAC.1